MSDDAKVSQRYRELATEEPPRALDDAIMAAARKAQRPWTQRHALPLGLAAALVLSVTVTLRLQHEQPGIEVPVPVAKAPAPAQTAQADTQLNLKVEADIKPQALERRAKVSMRDETRQDAPRPFAQPMQEQMREQVAAASAPMAEERTAGDAEAAARTPRAGAVRALAKASPVQVLANASPSPEQDLERIAELRRQQKHEEADKALAEFRKRLPDYKIPEAMRERVERR